MCIRDSAATDIASTPTVQVCTNVSTNALVRSSSTRTSTSPMTAGTSNVSVYNTPLTTVKRAQRQTQSDNGQSPSLDANRHATLDRNMFASIFAINDATKGTKEEEGFDQETKLSAEETNRTFQESS